MALPTYISFLTANIPTISRGKSTKRNFLATDPYIELIAGAPKINFIELEFDGYALGRLSLRGNGIPFRYQVAIAPKPTEERGVVCLFKPLTANDARPA